MDIKNEIINWFSEKTGTDAITIESKTKDNYFEEGWLDSLTFLEFVVFVEKNFNVKFSADDFQNPDFSTIDGITQIIKSK